jgi:hypothetical protein
MENIDEFVLDFSYEPMTEEECMKERFCLMADGIYQGKINKVSTRRSATGNPMAELGIEVYDKEGKLHYLKDYLVFTPKMLWKIKHAADSARLTKEYEEKKFHPLQLEDKNVMVDVKTQKGQEIPFDKLGDKPVGSKYPDKNVINDYVVTMKGATKDTPKDDDSSFLDDDISF